MTKVSSHYAVTRKELNISKRKNDFSNVNKKTLSFLLLAHSERMVSLVNSRMLFAPVTMLSVVRDSDSSSQNPRKAGWQLDGSLDAGLLSRRG